MIRIRKYNCIQKKENYKTRHTSKSYFSWPNTITLGWRHRFVLQIRLIWNQNWDYLPDIKVGKGEERAINKVIKYASSSSSLYKTLKRQRPSVLIRQRDAAQRIGSLSCVCFCSKAKLMQLHLILNCFSFNSTSYSIGALSFSSPQTPSNWKWIFHLYHAIQRVLMLFIKFGISHHLNQFCFKHLYFEIFFRKSSLLYSLSTEISIH